MLPYNGLLTDLPLFAAISLMVKAEPGSELFSEKLGIGAAVLPLILVLLVSILVISQKYRR
jgi:hypothetical protein